MKDLKDILSHFSLAGKILEIKPLGAGLINDSYKVTTAAPDTPRLCFTENQSLDLQRCGYAAK